MLLYVNLCVCVCVCNMLDKPRFHCHKHDRYFFGIIPCLFLIRRFGSWVCPRHLVAGEEVSYSDVSVGQLTSIETM
jgi:hypothetical protein